MIWPKGVRVGHTNAGKSGARMITLNSYEERLTPAEARDVARELILRADFQDRTEDTRLVDERVVRIGGSES